MANPVQTPALPIIAHKNARIYTKVVTFNLSPFILRYLFIIGYLLELFRVYLHTQKKGKKVVNNSVDIFKYFYTLTSIYSKVNLCCFCLLFERKCLRLWSLKIITTTKTDLSVSYYKNNNDGGLA